MTRGCRFQVEWKYGSSDWVPLKELKASHPVQLAEYAVYIKILRLSCLCMVGAQCAVKAQPDSFGGEVQLLENN